MSKEYLEILEKLKEHLKYEWLDDFANTEYYDILKQALQRLEAIDNAKPSEAIDWLLANETIYRGKTRLPISPALRNIKQALLRTQELEKVVDIIRASNVDIIYLKESNNVEEYNSHFGAVVCKLTPEEYDAVKRWYNER